jgi:hypothetical protein
VRYSIVCLLLIEEYQRAFDRVFRGMGKDRFEGHRHVWSRSTANETGLVWMNQVWKHLSQPVGQDFREQLCVTVG